MRISIADAQTLAARNGELVRLAVKPAADPSCVDSIAVSVHSWVNALLKSGVKPRVRVKAISVKA
jgi:hypothetical protein